MGILKKSRIEIGEWTRDVTLRILAEHFDKACDNPELAKVLPRFSLDAFFGCLNDDKISFLGEYPPLPENVKDEVRKRIEATSEDTGSPKLIIALAEGLATLALKLAEGWDGEEALELFVKEYIENGKSLSAIKN